MLRAVDVQQVLLQSSSVERVQQTQQQQSDMQQRYFEVQTGEEKKISKEKIKHSEEAEHAEIKKEEEKRRKRNRELSLRGEPTTAPCGEDEESPEDDQGGRIDIRV
jgi:hypothetical protein